MQILAMCGSLRKVSYNLALLRAVQSRLPHDTVHIFELLGEIPPFNPEETLIPDAVRDLRAQVKAADLIIIASPEYVHGVPGFLKNALDWVVGSGEWDGKPTVLFHVTPSAMEPRFVREGMAEIITVMSGGRLVAEASFVVTGAFKKFDPAGNIVDTALSMQLDQALAYLKSTFPAPG